MTASVPPARPHPEEPILVAGLLRAHDLAQDGADTAVQVQIERTLRVAGVERMPVRPGDGIDPGRHVGADGDPVTVGSVLEEVRPGWCLGDLVLRPAAVTVSAG